MLKTARLGEATKIINYVSLLSVIARNRSTGWRFQPSRAAWTAKMGVSEPFGA